jgi:hypothetical protein
VDDVEAEGLVELAGVVDAVDRNAEVVELGHIQTSVQRIAFSCEL